MIDSKRDELSRLHARIQQLEQENEALKVWVEFYRIERMRHVYNCGSNPFGGNATILPSED